MKAIKKILLVFVLLLVIVTTSSCGKDKRNTVVPYGDLKLSETVASIEGSTLTVEDYYSRLRASGYNVFYENLQKALFAEELAAAKAEVNLSDANVTETEQEIFDAVAKSIYSTAEEDKLNELTAEEIQTAVLKYIDVNNNKGIIVTEAQAKSYSFTDGKIKFSDLPQQIIDTQLLTIAMTNAAIAELDTIVDDEKIEDEDGNLVTNGNHISEKNIQSYYENSMRDFGTYNAIIIQFNNLTEANNAIAAATAAVGGSVNDTNAAKFYAVLYNSYYNYRTSLDENDPFTSEDTKYVVNSDTDELSKVSSSIKNFVINTLEDGEYLATPFNLNNKYIMVYRHSTVYEINEKYNVANKNEVIEWTELKDTIGETNLAEVKADIRKELIENKASSYTTTILNDRIEAAEIEIYDPFIEFKFASAFSEEYELITKKEFNDKLIYKCVYNDVTTELTVEDFYKLVSDAAGLTIIVEWLKADYVYQYKDKFLEEDAIETIENEIETAIDTFKKDENEAYPKSIGLETYLLASFGYRNEEQVKHSKVAASILSAYLSQKVFEEWATEDHTLNTNLNVLENILAAGNANYKNLFSINIDHILIYIDDNGDGTPDDPNKFINELSDAEKVEFNNAVLALSQAIYAEANCLELTESNDIMEILEYVVKAYDRNEPLYSNPSVTWESYKKYNFLLKVESLSSSGDTTQSNVGNYVSEFADYVKDLYAKAASSNLQVDDENPIFYFVESGENQPQSMEDICATEFGFHMIIVNDYSEPDGTDMKESSDSYGYQKNFEILLEENEDDTDDDNIYVVIENTYNDKTTEATMNQFFTYYVQKALGYTSTLDTNIQKLFASMFDEAINKYTSSTFQNILLINDMNIQIVDVNMKARFEGYKAYLVRTSKGYKAETDFDNWYDGSLNWDRPYAE